MGYFDAMQVCLQGHQITDTFNRYPQFRKNHCPKCGNTTIHRCPNCRNEIKGEYHVENFIDLSGSKVPVPEICEYCGESFPWSKKYKKIKGSTDSIWIVSLYKQAVQFVPILKYSWTIIATICILALTAYLKLKNTDVFVYAIVVILISFLAFVFSTLLKTGDFFIKVVLYFFITCLILTMATAVLGLASYIVFQKPVFYERLFPNESISLNSVQKDKK